MSNEGDANGVRELTEDDVERKPFQVRAAESRLDEVEPARAGSGESHCSMQLNSELIAQPSGNRVIKAHRFSDVAFDGMMKLDSQCSRAASTRRRNSASLIA